jgi:hypothetical protein
MKALSPLFRFMKPVRHLLAAALLLTGSVALAQDTNLLVVGGTHVRDGADAQAYITTQIESRGAAPGIDNLDLGTAEYSVHRKSGNPADASKYELVGVIRAVVDEPTVSALLERSWALKPRVSAAEQEADLNEKLDNMFGELSASAAGQSVSAKLANVVAGAIADPQYRADLVLLGKNFPGVNMVLGNAWSGPLPTTGPSTFEIRLRDSAGEDVAVVGRVTIDGSLATPAKLPAPGAPRNAGIEVSSAALPATAFSDFRSADAANEAKASTGFAELKEQAAFRKLNRAVRLRWSTPVTLRQRSILQNGYNVWRLPAESNDPAWLAAGPDLADIVAAGAERINTLPIVIPADLSAAEAADPSDTETNFYTDEISTEAPLPGGEKDYVYFVTALDVLGRDGEVSPGTVLTICDRFPPDVVGDLQVVNDYRWSGGTGEQRLGLSWGAVDPGTDGGTIEYEVYRWDRYDGAQRSIGATPVATTTATTWLDDIADSPTEANARETWWYTIRAVRVTGCGRFPAGHSGPVFGVIRDREGPAIVGTSLERPCLDPSIEAKEVVPGGEHNGDVTKPIKVTLRCTRVGEGIAWAEFSVKFGEEPGDEQVLARLSFGKGFEVDHVLSMDYAAFDIEKATLAKVRCRVGAINGAVSDYALALAGQNLSKSYEEYLFPFEARADIVMVAAGSPCPGVGQTYPADPDTGDVTRTQGGAEAEPDAVEFKYYRRVDGGDLSFIHREEVAPGAGPVSVSTFIDTNPPPINGGRVCYYVQAFDQDGNAGPMTLMEDGCLQSPPLAMPQPTLARPAPSDPEEPSRTLRLTWACPPSGVDRFVVYLSRNGFAPTGPLEAVVAPGLANGDDEEAIARPAPEGGVLVPMLEYGDDEEAIAKPPPDGVQLEGEGDTRFGAYVSPRIAGGFSGSPVDPLPSEYPAEFAIDLPVREGDTWFVAVSALAPPPSAGDGGGVPVEGPVSEVRSASWSMTAADPLNVAWPDRPIPPLLEPADFYVGSSLPEELDANLAVGGLEAAKLSVAQFDGIGVRIGEFDFDQTPESSGKGVTFIGSLRFNPNQFVYRLGREVNDLNSLFPCALYRHRVANPGDPGIGNDLVQVSPLMESIAYGFVSGTTPDPNGFTTALYDPFIKVVPEGLKTGLFLTDTLPVIEGTTYRYLLVRFDPNTKEPRDVIPVSNPVTVP